MENEKKKDVFEIIKPLLISQLNCMAKDIQTALDNYPEKVEEQLVNLEKHLAVMKQEIEFKK